MNKFLLIIILLMNTSVFAAEDYYSFAHPSQKQQFETLTSQLRCLVCQNQTIAESNAGLAADLRNEIFRQIQQGQSNDAIINYLVSRYGDYILYQPPFKSNTLMLWLLPFLFLLAGLFCLLFYIKRAHPKC